MQINQTIDYTGDGISMQGFISRKPSNSKQAVVLIVHDWSGCREPMHARAKYFAELGYVGFAVDLYGKDKRGADSDYVANQNLMQELMQDRAAIIKRLNAALETVVKIDNVDPDKIIALGFCLGGLCVLDFARHNAKVAGVISVHGILSTDNKDSTKINPKVLALHGYLDKMATPTQLNEFQQEMTLRKADWQTHVFGDAYHAFTNPKAHDLEKGLEFNSSADKRSWEIIEAFCRETFA